ncbi:MAG TPA: transporter substrate-binding domain-containing protein [Rhodopila sp.]
MMRMVAALARLPALSLAVAWPVAPAWPQVPDGTVAASPFVVCMQQNVPPLSLRAGDRPSGFDLALATIVARRLGRDLRVQWFVSRDDPDSSLPKDADALLSDGRCHIVAEYPLTEGALEPPRSPVAKLPPFDGAKPDDRRRWVHSAELAATRPYRLDTLTVVLSARDADRSVQRLADLAGMKIGVQTATLADAIAMRYSNGRLSGNVVHVPDTHDLFTKLQAGELDTAFVDQRAFDAWQSRHASSGLAASGYRHSIGFNMGFAGLASNRALLDQVDAVLADLQAHGGIAPLAAEAGLTFIPPRPVAVQPDVTLAALNAD